MLRNRFWIPTALFNYVMNESRVVRMEDIFVNNQLLSVKDIESALKLGHTKTAELISTGEIETFTIGRRRMTTPALLRQFIDRKIGQKTAAAA